MYMELYFFLRSFATRHHTHTKNINLKIVFGILYLQCFDIHIFYFTSVLLLTQTRKL